MEATSSEVPSSLQGVDAWAYLLRQRLRRDACRLELYDTVQTGFYMIDQYLADIYTAPPSSATCVLFLSSQHDNCLVPLLTRQIIRRDLIELMKTPGRNKGPGTAKKTRPAGLAAAESTLQPVSELNFGTNLVSNLAIGLEECSRYTPNVRKRKTLGQPRHSNLNTTTPLAGPHFWEQEMRRKHRHLPFLHLLPIFSRSLKALESTQSGRYPSTEVRFGGNPHASCATSTPSASCRAEHASDRFLYTHPSIYRFVVHQVRGEKEQSCFSTTTADCANTRICASTSPLANCGTNCTGSSVCPRDHSTSQRY